MNKLTSGPLVSVIVPVYNVEKYLACCLDSIVGQTYQNLDIILVNDGSTDYSGEICRMYQQRDDRIRIFTQENKSQSVARNTGIDNMKGDYVVFVDADDYISVNMIEVLLEKLLEYDVSIAMCDYIRVKDEDDHTMLDVIPGNTVCCKKMSRDKIFDDMLSDEFTRFVVVWGKIYDRKIFENLRFKISRMYEDEFFFHRIYRWEREICYIDFKLYAYRQSKNSTMRKNGKNCADINILKEYTLERISFFQEYGNPKYIRGFGKQVIKNYIYKLDWSDKRELRKNICEMEKELYHITGKRFLWGRCALIKNFPEMYQFMRKHYRRLKNILLFSRTKG